MRRDGEGIPLTWDGTAEDWIVRGHVDFAKAIAWASDCWESDEDGPPPIFDAYHGYARWCWEAGRDGNVHTLRIVPKSRGAFKITIARDADEYESRKAIRAQRMSTEARIRSEMGRRWPGCLIERIAPWGVGNDSTPVAFFRFPPFDPQALVSWREGAGAIEAPASSVAAWVRYRDSLPDPAHDRWTDDGGPSAMEDA